MLDSQRVGAYVEGREEFFVLGKRRGSISLPKDNFSASLAARPATRDRCRFPRFFRPRAMERRRESVAAGAFYFSGKSLGFATGEGDFVFAGFAAFLGIVFLLGFCFLGNA